MEQFEREEREYRLRYEQREERAMVRRFGPYLVQPKAVSVTVLEHHPAPRRIAVTVTRD